MDYKICDRVWKSPLTTSEKMVMLALDHLGDPDGFSWYGYETLGLETGISSGSKYLTKIINKLEKEGYILIWRQHGRKGGRGYTHIYWPIIGRTDDEIKAVIMRRFSATWEEAEAIIRQDGPLYQQLVKDNRISGEKLEQTRSQKGVASTPIDKEKGVPETPINDKGVTEYTHTPKKGVLESPRSKESLNPDSTFRQESKVITPPKDNPPESTKINQAFKVYFEITKYFKVHHAWKEKMAKKVGTDPAELKRWGDTVEAYIGKGWFQGDVKTMLEYFERREIPGALKNGKDSTNGYKPKQQQRQQPILPVTPEEEAHFRKLEAALANDTG